MNVIQRDLLTIERGIIAHQVNCKGVMGAGLACQIRQRYPQVFTRYKKYCDQGVFTLGKIQLIQVSSTPLYVANLAGQDGYGRNDLYTNYLALGECLHKLNLKAKELRLTPYLPYGIGCGLAGGKWSIVSSFIERYCSNAIICQK
jgi:O-acetyl-ADP-ribose deacetylase (regulator of RNase III)